MDKRQHFETVAQSAESASGGLTTGSAVSASGGLGSHSTRSGAHHIRGCPFRLSFDKLRIQSRVEGLMAFDL